MDITSWLHSQNGIGHTSDAVRAGAGRAAIDRAVAEGVAIRVRRSWLVAREARHTPLARAVRAGGRLTCVSAADHYGLWTFDDDRLHISVSRHAGRTDPNTVRHWAVGPVSPHPFEPVEPVENVLLHAARCLPHERALVIWESAVRKGATNLAVLHRLRFSSRKAHDLLAACSVLSDSGIETIPVSRLARIGIAVRQQVELFGHRVDGLIGDRLVYQIDGYEFHRDAAQRRRDIAHDRRLALAGYTVLRIDYAQVLFEWDAVEREIRLAMAAGAHLAQPAAASVGRGR